ncbi:cyclin-A2-4 [Citrus sinensis]|uniref:Cyclin-A2-4 n=1 Tax=Citrus sinensis TaxID=2711 RepID=A0ACB8JAZ8_CITSI|nr:cyclin-A2-4 [Citrus sinensis]
MSKVKTLILFLLSCNSSGEMTFLFDLITVEKDNFSGKLMTSCYPDHVDIDSDHTDPQLCSLYAADIYSNLQVAELNRRPFPNFMETVQRDITQAMRGILVDWLVEVSEEYKLVPDTLYMTVYLIDWFLCQNYIERQRLQLLGITCMLIASKYEEICAPRVEEFCFITDNTYSREEVLKMESQVLKCLGFQLFVPTTKTFLRRFLRAAQVSYKSPSLELEYLANFLAELSLVDYGFLKFIPSIIAASAVFLARWTMDQSSHPWNATLEHYTSYKASDLKVSAFALQDLQLNTNGCPLNAIRMKYRQEKSSPEVSGKLR